GAATSTSRRLRGEGVAASAVEAELAGDGVVLGHAAQLGPGGVLDLDAVLAPILLAQMLELARIVDLAHALGGLGRLEVAGKLGNLTLELGKRPEGVDLECRHEHAVVVATGRFDTEAEPGEQTAENLDDHRQAVAFIAFAAAD